MKFLCCSDTHGGPIPQLDVTDATGWLHAGDVHNRGSRSKEEKSPGMDEWIAQNKLPLHVVRGNHDCSLKSKFFSAFNDVTGSCIELSPGLLLLGIGWAGGEYYDLPTERDIRVVCDQARRMLVLKGKSGDKVIVLTHYPPWSKKLYDFDKNPEGWMFSAVTQLIEEICPLVVIQGHVHELFGNQMIYNGDACRTLIVSPGPKGGILTLDPESSSASFQF